MGAVLSRKKSSAGSRSIRQTNIHIGFGHDSDHKKSTFNREISGIVWLAMQQSTSSTAIAKTASGGTDSCSNDTAVPPQPPPVPATAASAAAASASPPPLLSAPPETTQEKKKKKGKVKVNDTNKLSVLS